MEKSGYNRKHYKLDILHKCGRQFLRLSVGEIFSSLAKQEGTQFLITVEEKCEKEIEFWIFSTEAITDTP